MYFYTTTYNKGPIDVRVFLQHTNWTSITLSWTTAYWQKGIGITVSDRVKESTLN